MNRAGMAAALSFILMMTACSKQQQEEVTVNEPKLPAVVPAARPPFTVVKPAPVPVAVENKVLPVVRPGHLPPNPRVALAGAPMADASAWKQQPGPQPPAENTAPAVAAAATAETRPLPAPVTAVRTLEQGNQARQRALAEMFRLRGQQKLPSPPAGTPASSPAETPAFPKKQP